jgi:flagellar hook protein FlgE
VSASTGMRVQGWQAEDDGGQMVVDPNGEVTGIQIPVGSSMAQATKEVIMGGNLDAANGGTPEDGFDLVVGVYNSLGGLQNVTLHFEKTADNTWSWSVPGDSETGEIVFDPADGSVVSGGIGNITVDGENGAEEINFELNFETVTQLAAESSISAKSVDGIAAGSLVGFDVISQTGEVLGIYSNGLKQLVGQLALANFSNPTGLVRTGNNLFVQGLNSGTASVGTANSGGRGSIVSGYLEASNVDLAKEFTNMILAQRGFQAQSRVITTSDEMMQELVNIKR